MLLFLNNMDILQLKLPFITTSVIDISIAIYALFIACIIAIIVSQRILLYYPTLLHRKKQLGERATHTIIGHRGSRLEGLPENTIAAFRDAVTAGADVIEMDVWLSKDGQVIVYHDETLSRMTQGACTARPFELEYKDYPRINPSTGQSERCSEYPEEEWQRIPLFEDALKVIPFNVGVNVEFKQDSDELIDKVATILSGHDERRLANMYWFSLDESINRKLRRKAMLPTISSIIALLKIIVFYHVGILPFIPLADEVVGFPLFEITLEDLLESPLGCLHERILTFSHYIFRGRPSNILFHFALFEHLRRRGINIWVMGVETDKDWDIARSFGAVSALTDSPSKLRHMLDQNDQKVPISDGRI